MKQPQLEAFLGRPLTPTEVSNLTLYLKLAKSSLEEMLCTTLCDVDDPKFYDARDGYRTLFTDIFTDIEEVKVDGEVIDPSEYSPRQWNKRNGSWFNSIVFNNPFKSCDKEVEVSATWGFTSMPADLLLMQARLFDLLTKQNKLDREINSKKVEDFTVTFNHSSITMSDTLMQSFQKDNASTVAKYSMCDIGDIKHGEVCTWR